ncbi:PREDICTED: periphilin-1-like [Myotis brandtii]|uniref:periphilin-1-like n=1 Tax=Myotis brandtii TaxID=109478 RepID=UPI0003BB91AD|nr:PREDICTED: periphilin-1-like [Myotis brandtii]
MLVYFQKTSPSPCGFPQEILNFNMDLREELARLIKTLLLETHLAVADNRLPEPQIAAAPSKPLKIRSGRRTRRMTNSPEVTWGMVKKPIQKAERICEKTKIPRTPENVFLAMLAVTSCASTDVE